MLNITIRTIPHSNHRYPTCGDWQFDPKDPSNRVLTISVSDMDNTLAEFLVAIHELIEAMLCRQDGVTEARVDEFDMNWNKAHIYPEPGDDPEAPYHRQHVLAGTIERLLAQLLGIEWEHYEDLLCRLDMEEA